MTYLENPYGFCPVCNHPGEYRERRPNGNDRCKNGHIYPSKSAIQGGETGSEKLTIDAASSTEKEHEIIKLNEKIDRLRDQISQINVANVDRWNDGWKAAEKKICSWLLNPCENEGHDDRWCQICSIRSDIADQILSGIYKNNLE